MTHRFLVRFLAGAFAGGVLSCASADERESDEDIRARTRWTVNDVSVLFPKPSTPDEGALLLSMQNDGRTLLPEKVFKLLGDPASGHPYLFEAPGKDQAWSMLRVTAVRIDPCFDAKDAAQAHDCIRQVRLTAQVFWPGTNELADASVHLFYLLNDDQFVHFARGLRALKRENSSRAGLGVHPVMKEQGLGGTWAKRLRDLITTSCDESKLSRMTFMATGRSGNNWFWGVLDRQADGTFAPSVIPTKESAGDGFHQNGRGDTYEGVPLGDPQFPDALLSSANVRQLSDDAFARALLQLQAIENPSLLRTGDVACSSCHVAGMALSSALYTRGLSQAPTSASQFVPPPSQNVVNRTAAEMRRNGRNMHAFSWFQDEPVVSQRVIHESANVASFLGTDAFTQSLSPSARKEWLRR